MIRTTMTAMIAALLANGAAANGIEYARFSYDYSDFAFSEDDFDNKEFSTGVFQGEVEYRIDQILLGAGVRNFSTDLTDDGDRVIATAYDAWAGYQAIPTILFGAGVNGITNDSGDRNGFDLFGQYVEDAFAASISVQKQDSGEDNLRTILYGEASFLPPFTIAASIVDNSEFDGTGYYLSAEYAANNIAARSFLVGNTEVDGGEFGIRGDYTFSENLRVSAVYDVQYGDDVSDVSFFGAGGGYQVADGAWFDLDVGSLDIEGDAATRIQATISFETGTRARLDQAFEQDRFDDTLAGQDALF